MKKGLVIPCIRFKLKKDRTILFADGINFLPELLTVRCRLSAIHGFRHITDRQPKRQAAKQDLCSVIAKDQAHRLPAKILLKLTPFTQLQEMRVRMRFKEVIPIDKFNFRH